MKRFEYKELFMSIGTHMVFLNDLGREGWQAVNVRAVDGGMPEWGKLHVILMREVSDE